MIIYIQRRPVAVAKKFRTIRRFLHFRDRTVFHAELYLPATAFESDCYRLKIAVPFRPVRDKQ
jgi:hypothetical protein